MAPMARRMVLLPDEGNGLPQYDEPGLPDSTSRSDWRTAPSLRVTRKLHSSLVPGLPGGIVTSPIVQTLSEKPQQLLGRAESEFPAGVDLFNPADELLFRHVAFDAKTQDKRTLHDPIRVDASRGEGVKVAFNSRETRVTAGQSPRCRLPGRELH